MIRFYSRLMDSFRTVTGVLFAMIILLTITQVFCRFVLDSPLVWSEELSRLLFVWMTMFGAPVLTYRRIHLAIPELTQSFPDGLQGWLDLLMNLMVTTMLFVVVVTSLKLLRVSWRITSGALQLPFSFWRAAAPFGCFFMSCSILVRCPEMLRRICNRGKEVVR